MESETGKRNPEFVARMMAIARYGDCINAGLALVEGNPNALDDLRNNGRWGVSPWPSERLEAATRKAVDWVKLHAKTPSQERAGARLVVCPAIADVLGVPAP